jgi:predicted transcriptional regulator
MNASRDRGPRRRRYTARYQARPDDETHATLENLTKTLHRKRGQILRHVIQWGLSHSGSWTIDEPIPMSTQPVPVLLEPALQQRVQDASAAHRVSTAAWIRQAMRRIALEEFPASWRAEETTPRSHESGYYGTRFMLRLDDQTSSKLRTLTQTFHRSAAEVIRQLIAQARPEDFPPSWQLAV